MAYQSDARPAADIAAGMGYGRVVDLGERPAMCDVHGPYMAFGRRMGAWERWFGCPHCRAEESAMVAAAEAQAALEARQKRFREKLDSAELPALFRGRTLGNYVAETEEQRHALAVAQDYATNFAEHRQAGDWLVFLGRPGTGKSHLAAAIMQHVLVHGTAYYTTALGLVRMLRDCWDDGAARTEAQVWATLMQADLLVIDEIGVQFGSDAETLQINELLDRRYRELRPVILLSNLSVSGLREVLGDRIMDRLRQKARVVPFRWDSYRQQARMEGA